MNNFDRLAGIYDLLSKLIYGQAIEKAQATHLNLLKSGSAVLIVGGGTGKILNRLDELNISITIDYLEKSKNMVKKAKKYGPFKNLELTFIASDLLDSNLSSYDVIITSFFLDVFEASTFQVVFNKLSNSLNPEGLWLNADFRYTGHLIKDGLIKLMYLFFRVTTQLQAKRLPSYQKAFNQNGYELHNITLFYHQMIESCVYQKK